MILLKNHKRCPRCFYDTVSRDLNKCTRCSCRLMWPDSNFAELEREYWRDYYIFFQDIGWCHSTKLADRKPNDPILKAKKPDKDYGTQPLPAGCSAD